MVLGSAFAGVLQWRPRILGRPKQAAALLFAAAFIGYCSYRTVIGNLTWRDEISLWRKAAQKTPDVAFFFFKQKTAYEMRGLSQEAKEEYLKAIRLDPNFANPHANLGGIYRAEGNLDAAVRELRIAVGIEPLIYNAWNNLGAALCEQGKYKEAIGPFREAIRLAPGFVAARTNLARAYQELGRYEEAAKEYREALKLQPELPKIELELARCYRWAGHVQKARKMLLELAYQTDDLGIQIQAREELDGLNRDERGIRNAK